MKSQIVPVLIFCMVLPWLVSRVFKMEGCSERLRVNCQETIQKESFSGGNIEKEGRLISYEGLSTKQINFLIP
jgi:hypothetical protein